MQTELLNDGILGFDVNANIRLPDIDYCHQSGISAPLFTASMATHTLQHAA